MAGNYIVLETGYVKKDKVIGSSYEVGAKVTYEGHDMIVSKAPDRDGEIKMLDYSGLWAICAVLPAMKELKELK